MLNTLYGLSIVVIIGTGTYFFGDYFQNQFGFGTNDNQEILVYETDADRASDCSSYEEYDSVRKVCSFECVDENECNDIQTQIDDELNSWTDELKKDKSPVAEKSIKEGDESQIADYKVALGEKISLVSGKDTEENRQIWDEIKSLSPDDISDKYIEEYQVFDNAGDDTLAFVDDEDGNGKWRIAVNLSGRNDSNEREQKTTIIHELGHIISLNLSQVDPNIEKQNCNTFYLEEGCTKINSYINNFKNLFWKNVSNQEYDENKFVTEYAASSEVEDFAESFAFFVLEQNPTKPKLKFFYSYPEFVVIRSDMRNSLSQGIVRARKYPSF